MFKDLRISTRLACAFGLLTVLLLGVIGMALYQMGAMRAVAQEINRNWLPSVELVNQMNTGTSDFRIAEINHILNTDDTAMAAIEKEMALVLAEFERDHDAYVKLISSDEERKLYEQFASEWKQYLLIHDRMIAHSRKNETPQAKALLDGDGKKWFNASSATLLKMVAFNHQARLSRPRTATRHMPWDAIRWSSLGCSRLLRP